ncbi:MAG: ATP-binding protein [Actinobacteria bacterium]|nr:ATP-binding protein [Actinomycetota bacterium]
MKVDLPPGPGSSAEARKALRRICQGAPVDLEHLVLCASELVTNAFLHGQPPVELEIRVGPKSVWVAVHDAGSGAVELRRPATPDTSAGRGLHIVEAVASRWGSSAHERGNTTWFEIEGE